MSTLELLKLIWPLIVVEFALLVVALVNLLKKKKTKNLSVTIWALIIVFIGIFGPIAYFLLGRTEE